MVVILSRDPDLYSTRSLVWSCEKAGFPVKVLDVLSLEVKVGRGVYQAGKHIEPTLVIPRLSSQLLVAGLAVVREWEHAGITVVNSSTSISTANNQLATLQRLSHDGIPVPETSFCSQPLSDDDFSSLIGECPRVIKLLDASQGKGVTLAKDAVTAKSMLSTLATLRSSGITQHFHAESDGRDYRLIVMKGDVVAAIERTSKAGDFRANIHQGASAKSFAPTAAQCYLAVRAAASVGLGFAGVDLLPTSKGEVVLEVNASPGLRGVEGGVMGSVSSGLVGRFYPLS